MAARALLVALSLLLSTPALAETSPTRVTTTVSLRNGNWFPLPAEDMKAAAGDAALDEISNAGLLERVERGGRQATGSLSLDLSLVGKAETAQMTITLSHPSRPTFVSSASISVRRLEYREIHRALQHVGRESAQRLNAKLRAHGPFAATDAPAEAPATVPPSDPELREAFEDAQRAKHALRYDEARMLFEQVAHSEGGGETSLAKMASDELRYGLPAFEAKQSLLSMAQPFGAIEDKLGAVGHAENLYRQIHAENQHMPERIAEAQRALDDLAVTRRAMKTAMASVTMSRMSQIRVMLLQSFYMEGQCPDERSVEQLLDEMKFGFELTAIEREGAGRTARYTMVDASTEIEMALVCDDDIRIEPPPARRR